MLDGLPSPTAIADYALEPSAVATLDLAGMPPRSLTTGIVPAAGTTFERSRAVSSLVEAPAHMRLKLCILGGHRKPRRSDRIQPTENACPDSQSIARRT